MAWIKAIWTDIALEPEWSEPRFRDRQIASSAFKLARTCGHWGWEKKAKALEVMYEALRGTDSSWVKDEDYLLW